MKRPSRWPIALALLAMTMLAWFLASNLSADEVPVSQSDARGVRAELALGDIGQTDQRTQPAPTTSGDGSEAQTDTSQTDTSQTDTGQSDSDAVSDNPVLPTAVPLVPEPLVASTALDWVLDEVGIRSEISSLHTPASGCVSADPSTVVLEVPGSPSRYRCPAGNVSAIADGRVLMAVRTQPEGELATPTPGQTSWEWERGAELGRFVVIDHGAMGVGASVISVYSRLGEVDPNLTVGAAVLAGEVIGTLSDADPIAPAVGAAALREQRAGEFMFELWVDDEFSQPEFQVDSETALRWASTLSEISAAPADRVCGFPAGVSSLLPNAPRQYRAGVHRGIDFNCGRGHDAYAYTAGTVVLVVNDFADPAVAAREATLSNAAAAGATPHWILMMLYGNVVVIDHGEIPGVGRVTTISAHLDSVDPSIAVGAEVATGQRLGEIGNAGTNAGAVGSNATVHLHWELFVDGTHLAKGLSAGETSSIYATALCRVPEALNGC